MSSSLDGKAGRWNWDGRYVTNSSNSSLRWEWDGGRYLTNSSNSSLRWEWDGRYLTNSSNSSERWEWDGSYLSYQSERVRMPTGAPIPVLAVVEGIVR